MLRFLGVVLLIAFAFTGCGGQTDSHESVSRNPSSEPQAEVVIVSDSSEELLQSYEDSPEASNNSLEEDGRIITSTGIIIDANFISELWNILEIDSQNPWEADELLIYKKTHPDLLFEINFANSQRINRFVENYKNGVKDSFMVFDGEGWGPADYLILYDYNGKGQEYTYSCVIIMPSEHIEEYGISHGKETILNNIGETELTYIFGAYDNGQIVFPKYGWQPIKVAETIGEVTAEEAKEKLFPLVKEKTEKYHQGDIWLVHVPQGINPERYGEDAYDFLVYFQNPETPDAKDFGLFRVAKDLSWFSEVESGFGIEEVQYEPAPPPATVQPSDQVFKP